MHTHAFSETAEHAGSGCPILTLGEYGHLNSAYIWKYTKSTDGWFLLTCSLCCFLLFWIFSNSFHILCCLLFAQILPYNSTSLLKSLSAAVHDDIKNITFKLHDSMCEHCIVCIWFKGKRNVISVTLLLQALKFCVNRSEFTLCQGPIEQLWYTQTTCIQMWGKDGLEMKGWGKCASIALPTTTRLKPLWLLPWSSATEPYHQWTLAVLVWVVPVFDLGT